MEKSNNVSNLNEPSEDQDPLQEEPEVKHLGYASHLMDMFCDSEESTEGTSLTKQESLSKTMPTEKTVVEYEYDVRTTGICEGSGDQELSLQEEVILQGKLFEPQTALADTGPHTLLYSYAPQLRDLAHKGPEEEPSTTLVNWDPWTGRLCIPSLSSFELDSGGYEHPEYKELTGEGLLSRLYEKQAPDEPPEEDKTYLMQFLEEWELYVQMED